MDNYKIVNPNLPENDVTLVVMSTINSDLVNAVGELGVKIIETEPLRNLLPFEQTHADMQIFHYNKDTVFVLSECKTLQKHLNKYFKNIITTSKSISKNYPENVLLNAVSINSELILHNRVVDKKIIDIANNNRTYIHSVKQGYTKCSTCIVTENAIITADKSIYKNVSGKLDVLLINEGYIELPGTNYGFIGGCSFKYNKSNLMFTGKISEHPDYVNIKSFCRNHNVYVNSLTKNNLLDIGSIIPILEK